MLALTVLAAVLLGAVAAVQGALAGGAPLGALAWGGRYPGVLPMAFRIGSGVSIVILALFAAVLLARASVFGADWAERLRLPTFVVAGFLSLNTLGNLASRSPYERWIMGPLALITAIIAWVLAVRA